MKIDFKNRWTGEPSAHPVPFERSFWILDGLFLAGLYPRTTDEEESRQRVSALVDAGVRHIVDLTEGDEVTRLGPLLPYGDLLMELTPGVTWQRIPIRDMGIASEEVIRDILDSIDRHLEKGEPVYLHCLGGLGRTGMVLGCWIARHGFATGDEALFAIARLREHTVNNTISPQTWEQCRVVQEWEPRK